MRTRSCALVLMALAVPALAAQEVSGRVTTGAGAAIPAAVVAMLDSAGGTLVRALTDQQGRYRLPAHPHARTLRATRIGFRPRTVALRVTGTPQDIAIAMEQLPTMLQAIEVLDQPGCPARRDRHAAFALWDQARAGLLSTVVARQENSAALERFVFYRIVDEHRRNVLSQLVQVDTARGSRPFGASRSARQFVELGFEDANTGTFFAPDADVLLDDAFSRGYCFRLADGDRKRPHQVGLRFEPAVRRRGRVDIDGTLWVDTAARALSDLEYRYLGLPSEAAALRLGGRVAFAAMPPGFPAITEWSMRVAAPSSRAVTGLDIASVAVVRQSLEVHELGGELARARFGDTAWTARLGSVSGRVMRDTLPAAGVVVHLVGTPYTALTDSTGAFAMQGLIPGRYIFGVPDAGLNASGFELTLGQAFVSNRDAQRVTVTLPTQHDFVHSKCRTGKDTTSLLIAGRIFDMHGMPAADTRVEVYRAVTSPVAGAPAMAVHLGPGAQADGYSNANLRWERLHRDSTGARSMFYLAQDGATGSGGAFFICKAPASALLRLDAIREGERGSVVIGTNVRGRRIYTPRLDMKP